MIQTVFGLIDECLETDRQDVNVLKLAYEVIDEKKYMIQGSSNEAQKASPISKLLLKYYKKKKDETSN